MCKKCLIKILSLVIISLMILIEMSSIIPSIILASTNSNAIKLTSSAHVQSFGWMNWITTNANSSVTRIGTTGKRKRMEAIEINIEAPEDVTLKYRAHVQGIGWMNWITADNKNRSNYIGTTGQKKRLEGIQIAVEGLEGYEIKYRGHVQNLGWLDWITASETISSASPKVGEFAGTTGKKLRMEALEIMIIPVEKVEEQPNEEIKPEEDDKIEEDSKVEPNQEDKIEPNQEDKIEPNQDNKIEEDSKVEPNQDKKVEKDSKVEPNQEDKIEKDSKVEPNQEDKKEENPKIEQDEEKSQELPNEEKQENKSEWGNSEKQEEPVKPQETLQQGQEEPSIEIEPEPQPQVQPPKKQVSANHIHDYTEWKVEVKATCLNDGLEKRTCKTCGAVETKRITAHELIRDEKRDKAPTCTQRGEEHYICKNCGQIFFNYSKPMLGHLWESNYTVDKEATCTQDGIQSIHCSREGCNERKDVQIIKAVGHDYKQIVTKATCTADGVTKTECTKCGKVTKSIINEKRLGHNFANYVDNHDATCTKDATKTGKCTRCSKTNTITIIGSKLQHEYEEKILQNATCSTAGKVEKTCKVCGNKTTYIIPTTNHNWKTTVINSSCRGSVTETICTECGEAKDISCHAYGEGHTWSGDKCSKCGMPVPKWTNAWSSNVFYPALRTVLEQDGCRTQGTTAVDYNSLTAKGRTELEKELKRRTPDYNKHNYIRAVWVVFYVCNLNECDGFAGQDFISKTVITADWKFVQEAPKAKAGYEFDGWVDAHTGQKVPDSMLKENSNGEKTVLVVGWENMDKTFKPCYRKVS